MPTTIDSLAIDINAEAGDVSSKIDALATKLGKLATSIGSVNGTGLVNISNGLKSLNGSMQGLSNVNQANYTRIAKGLTTISSVDGVKLNSVAVAVDNVGKSLTGISNISGVSKQIADLTKGISSLGYKSSTKAIENIPKLATAMRQLMAELSKAPMVSNNLIQMTNALGNLARTGASSGKVANSLNNVLNTFSRSSDNARKKSFSLAGALGKLYAEYWLVFRGMSKIKSAVDYAADLTEVQNVVDNSFGEMTGKVNDFAKQSIKSLGMSELSFKTFASQYQSMGNAMSIGNSQIAKANDFLNKATDGYISASDSLADVSLNMTKLAGDMASFYNKDQAEVAEDLRAVYTGMVIPLRKYGLDLTQATLKEWAMKNGMDANIESMSQAEKTMLRYQYVMANTKQAQGDFIRTQDTWANQTRMLAENFRNLGVAIGTPIINAAKPFVAAINQMILKVTDFAKVISSSLGTIFGWKYEVGSGGITSDMEDAEDAAGGIAESTGTAANNAKKLKNYLMGIDELNVRQEDTSSVGGGAGGGTGGGSASTENALGKWVEVEKDFKNELSNLYALGTYIGTTVSEAIESIDWNKAYKKASGFGKGLADFLNGLISPRLFGDLGQTIAGSINLAILSWKSFWTNFDGTNLGLSVANGINKFFKTIKAKDLAEGMNAFVDTIEDAIGTAITNISWKTVFSKIGDFLGNLDADTVLFFLGVQGIKKFGKQIGKAINKQLTFDAVLKVGKAVIKLGKNITGKLLRNNFVSTLLLAFGSGAKAVGTTAIQIALPVTIMAVASISFAKWWQDSEIGKETRKQVGEVTGSTITSGGAMSNQDFFVWTTILDSITGKTKETKKATEELSKSQSDATKTTNLAVSQGKMYADMLTGWKTKINDWQTNNKSKRESDLENQAKFVEDSKLAFDDLATKISEWYTNSVSPWFAKEKWHTLGKNMSDGIKTKWNEFKEWWKSTGIYKWWTENVAPWFTKEKWEKMASGMKSGIKAKWAEVKEWWKKNKFLSEIKVGMPDLVQKIKDIWTKAEKWWKENVKLSIPDLNFHVEYKTDGLNIAQKAIVKALDLQGWPKLKFFENGGFPEIGDLFMANEHGIPELVGTMNGRPAVGSGQEITGISNAVYTTAQEEMALMREQNNLLRRLLEKDFGTHIGDRDIARATIRGQKQMGMQIIT